MLEAKPSQRPGQPILGQSSGDSPVPNGASNIGAPFSSQKLFKLFKSRFLATRQLRIPPNLGEREQKAWKKFSNWVIHHQPPFEQTIVDRVISSRKDQK